MVAFVAACRSWERLGSWFTAVTRSQKKHHMLSNDQPQARLLDQNIPATSNDWAWKSSYKHSVVTTSICQAFPSCLAVVQAAAAIELRPHAFMFFFMKMLGVQWPKYMS